ncbi:MAG: TIGR03118 family protein, partial [Alloacidobacterium sp.]
MKNLRCVAASAAIALCAGTVAFGQHYKQTNLVANTAGVAPVTDPNLVNPWGLSRGSGSPWWVSDNATGLSTLYNGPGAIQGLVVTIPPADPTNPKTPLGTPTGTIFNGSTTDFLLAPNAPATFLFSTIDGTIVGWNATINVTQGAKPPSTHAVTVA